MQNRFGDAETKDGLRELQHGPYDFLGNQYDDGGDGCKTGTVQHGRQIHSECHNGHIAHGAEHVGQANVQNRADALKVEATNQKGGKPGEGCASIERSEWLRILVIISDSETPAEGHNL